MLDWLADFLVRPTSLPSCLTIFIGYHSLLGYNSRFSHLFTARILVKLPGIYVTLCACLPLPSVFVRYAHLTVMISLSREQGLLRLRHKPLQPVGPALWNQLLPSTRSTLLAGEPNTSFRSLKTSLWVSRTGSASDWCALQEALYKCIDTIQYCANILT